VGIAWESGLIAGLAQNGVDVSTADFTMGTSAGSFVGARLALGADPKTLADPILAERPPAEGSRSAGPAPDLSTMMRLMDEALSGRRNPAEVRAEIGAFALAAQTMDEQAFLDSFGRSFSSLAADAWPQKPFACTAVDAETGAFTLWTEKSGVGVVRAVASSCSVPGVYPPVTLKGRRYIDGGMRSPTNADMAVGHQVVMLIAIRVGGGGANNGGVGDKMSAQLDEEVESLKEGGATVLTITPDDAAVEAFGGNLMDFGRRAAAASAGVAQGLAYAKDVRPYWP
jgi:NTE family protein